MDRDVLDSGVGCSAADRELEQTALRVAEAIGLVGVDMPSLAPDLALGRPLPDSVPFAEVAVVRHLEDVVLDEARR